MTERDPSLAEQIEACERAITWLEAEFSNRQEARRAVVGTLRELQNGPRRWHTDSCSLWTTVGCDCGAKTD